MPETQPDEHVPEGPAEDGAALAPAPAPVAGFARRCTAYLIDLALALGICVVLSAMLLVQDIGANHGTIIHHPYRAQILIIAVIVLYFGPLGTRRGQSLGKRITRIRIVDLSGAAVRSRTVWARAALRFAIPITTGLVNEALAEAGSSRTPVAVLGVIFAVVQLADLCVAPLLGDHRRTLADRLCGTAVVEAGPVASVGEVLPQRRPGAALLLPVLGIALLAGAYFAGAAMSKDDGPTGASARHSAVQVGRAVQQCIDDNSGRLPECGTKAALGLPIALGIDEWVRVDYYSDLRRPAVVVRALSGAGATYGIAFFEGGQVAATCMPSEPCDADPGSAAFARSINSTSDLNDVPTN